MGAQQLKQVCVRSYLGCFMFCDFEEMIIRVRPMPISYARNFTYYSFQNFPKILPIILLIITYYSHKILLTILHAGYSEVK